VSDRFGDYGLVGIIIFELCREALIVDTFALSCRALGKQVEHKMLASVGEIALSRDLATVEPILIPTQRNAAAQQFMSSCKAEQLRSSDGKLTYRFRAVELATPATRPTQPLLAAEHVSSPLRAHEPASASDVLWKRKTEEIASCYNTVPGIMAAMRRSRSGRKDVAKYVSPRTETERIIAELWSEVLSVDNPGIYDDFFGSGGHSLRAAQIAARIREAFQVDFPLKTFFGMNPTIEGLSEAVERLEIATFGADNAPEALARK
jgi:acyl carrier protein